MRLPVQHLTTFRAQPDEVEEAFVLRVGTFLERFSAAHGHEACAALVLVDDRLVARVSTNGSHVGCLAVTQAGDRYTGRSIHSHQRPGVVRLEGDRDVDDPSGWRGRYPGTRQGQPPSRLSRLGKFMLFRHDVA